MTVFVLLSSSVASPGISQKIISEKNPYVFGVFPFISIQRVEAVFLPVVLDLERVLGRRIQFQSASSFERFQDRLSHAAYDIAFIQPFDYVEVAVLQGYEPVAKVSQALSAVLVTANRSEIKTVQDLKHHAIGLPPQSAAVSRLVLRILKQNGIDPERDLTLRYFKTHDSCLQQVLIHAISACGTAPNPLALFEKKMNVVFRPLGRSEAIPGALFVVHPRVPEVERKRIQKMLIALSTERAGSFWAEMRTESPFVSAHDADFDIVRKMLLGE